MAYQISIELCIMILIEINELKGNDPNVGQNFLKIENCHNINNYFTGSLKFIIL